MIPVDLYVNPMSKGKEYINKSARYQKAHDANFNTPDLHVRFRKGTMSIQSGGRIIL